MEAGTVKKERVVWHGAKALRRFIVPIAELEPFPRNPRRGDVQVVRASLRRFGQTRPVLVDAANGRRIVAGHHVVLGAREEGWTHVAAIPNEFRDDDEARAYMVTDNRSHDLGAYDLEDLHAHLTALQQSAGLDGTGYDDRDVENLHRDLEAYRLAALPPQPPSAFPPIDPAALEIQHRCPSCGYEWSGNPAPGGEPEPGANGDASD